MTKPEEVYCDFCGKKIGGWKDEHLKLGKYVFFQYKPDWVKVDVCKSCKADYLSELGSFNRKYVEEHMTDKSIEEHNQRYGKETDEE